MAELVLHDKLKVNSIEPFPQPFDKSSALVRVKSDETSYELVDLEQLKEELQLSSKDQCCINSVDGSIYTIEGNVLKGQICNLEATFPDGHSLTVEQPFDINVVPMKHFERCSDQDYYEVGRYYFEPTSDTVEVKLYEEEVWKIVAYRDYNPIVTLKPFRTVRGGTVWKEVDGVKTSEDQLYLTEVQNVLLALNGRSLCHSGRIFYEAEEPRDVKPLDIWYNTKQLPMICSIYNNGTWQETHRIPLGTVILENGVPTRFQQAITNYNGTIFPKNAVITLTGTGYVYHGLNIVPEQVSVTSPQGACYITNDVVRLIGNPTTEATFNIRLL